MLDRQAVQEFLESELEDWGVKPPKNINMIELTKAFCLYVEGDYYEWLKENTKSFFTVTADGIDWEPIRRMTKKSKKDR